jgi:hypothetical protein
MEAADCVSRFTCWCDACSDHEINRWLPHRGGRGRRERERRGLQVGRVLPSVRVQVEIMGTGKCRNAGNLSGSDDEQSHGFHLHPYFWTRTGARPLVWLGLTEIRLCRACSRQEIVWAGMV